MMPNRSRRTSRITLWAAIVAVATVAAFAAPAMVSAGHAWANYHWARTSNPFTLKTGDNVTSAWDAYLDEAISDWSASAVLNLTKVAGTQNVKRCSGTTGRIEVCNAKYGNNGWLGIAGISISGDHITKGYVKLNDTYYASATYNTPAYRRFVMCQEIGHAFGLSHVNETFTDPNTGSCMDYTNDPDGPPSNEHPNGHDFDMIDAIYAHLDSTSTVGARVPADERGVSVVDQLDQNHRAAWGRLIAASRGHGIEIYELNLGHGRKQVTFVTWTVEEAAHRHAEFQAETRKAQD